MSFQTSMTFFLLSNAIKIDILNNTGVQTKMDPIESNTEERIYTGLGW